MIFVTVGAQMPFDRLVRRVDAWAAGRPGADLFAQIGTTPWRPAHMDWATVLEPQDYRNRLFEADLVITHAGMGTILTAMELGKPLVVMPRRGPMRETRNDHQVATARAFARAGLVSVAWDEMQLAAILEHAEDLPQPPRVGAAASIELLSALRTFIRPPTPACPQSETAPC